MTYLAPLASLVPGRRGCSDLSWVMAGGSLIPKEWPPCILFFLRRSCPHLCNMYINYVILIIISLQAILGHDTANAQGDHPVTKKTSRTNLGKLKVTQWLWVALSGHRS